MKLTRILWAFAVLFALILDALWRTGQLREWSWEWAITVAAFLVIIFDLPRLKE